MSARFSCGRKLGLAGLLLAGSMVWADGPTFSEREDRLRCGEVELVAKSDCVLLDSGKQCRRQTLTLHADGKEKTLPNDGRAVKKQLAGPGKVLDGFVTGWACINSSKGTPYLLLAYSCSFGEERGACARGEKEWMRLFSLDGRHLTAGLSRQDKRADALFDRLGLSETLEAGVKMQGLDP
ncbi:hypothetical protein [Chitinimonas lacunae]|uniref:Uncharacterized protein n=1 Tax=Chitinimonas lacunae TaxID=1963018 RepID=A0ABV8MVL5_9NEIS